MPGFFETLNALSTAAVAIFALVQLMYLRDERRHRLRSALGSIWVEWWRMQTVQMRWENSNLCDLALSGSFVPSDILPSGRDAVLPLLGELGMQAARFGGIAFTTAGLAAHQGELLCRSAEARIKYRSFSHTREETDAYEQSWQEAGKKLEAGIKNLARRAVQEFEDSLKSAPLWLRHETFRFDDLTSDFARATSARLEDFALSAHKAPLGVIGRRLGAIIERACKWLNPASAHEKSGSRDGFGTVDSKMEEAVTDAAGNRDRA